MTKEEYKKKVRICLLNLLENPIHLEEIMNSDADWEGFMKDFSPETAAQGLSAGLI